MILGDFNESQAVGDARQSLAVSFQAKTPMVDALSTLSGKISTHADGQAYDRIILSHALADGLAGLKWAAVQILEHRHGKGPDRRLYTGHFPVLVNLIRP